MELTLPKKILVTKHQYRNLRKVPLRHRLTNKHNEALEDPGKTTEERNESVKSFSRKDQTYGHKHYDTRN